MPRRAKVQEKPLTQPPISLRLSKPQLNNLRALTQQQGLGMSEIIRRAFDHYVIYMRTQKAA
jgi:hypothetical protein